jgi:hypothetical protein
MALQTLRAVVRRDATHPASTDPDSAAQRIVPVFLEGIAVPAEIAALDPIV